MIRTSTSLAALAVLAACAPVESPENTSQASACPVLASRNWHAWIDKMPGPEAQMTLNISGEVDMPTPGYRLALKQGAADRMMPPGVRFTFEAEAPGGMVTQVVTSEQVSFRAPTLYPQIREIIIACNGEALVTIPDVMITE